MRHQLWHNNHCWGTGWASKWVSSNCIEHYLDFFVCLFYSSLSFKKYYYVFISIIICYLNPQVFTYLNLLSIPPGLWRREQ